MRAGDKLVDVEVVNIFAENSKQNEMTVSEAINKRISNNSADFESYASKYQIILFNVYLNTHLLVCRRLHCM